MTIGQFARRTHLERTRAETARVRRGQHRDRARHPVRDRLGRRLRARCRRGSTPSSRSGSSSRSAPKRRLCRLRPQLPRGLTRRERPRDARARRARRGHCGLRRVRRTGRLRASTCTPSATPASPTVRRAYASSGSARSSTRCSRPPHASRRSCCSSTGSRNPSPALTLPWAIARSARLCRRDLGGRSSRSASTARPAGAIRLGKALDSIYVLRCLFCSACAPGSPDRNGGLLVRRHRVPLGVPAGFHARHAGRRGPPHRLCDRLCADAADAAVRRRRRSRGRCLPLALSWTGIPLAAAVLAVFTYRIFNFWLPLVPAALGLRSLKAADAALDDHDARAASRLASSTSRARCARRRARPPAASPVKLTVVLRRVRPRRKLGSVRLGPSTSTSSTRPMRSSFRSPAMRCTTSTSRSIRSRFTSSGT